MPRWSWSNPETQHLMMVLPADHQIDLEKVEKAIGKAVSLG